MAIDVSRMDFQHVAAQQQAGAARAAESGVFMGQAVREAPSPEELLADAAEELAFAADTTDDFELEERRDRDKSLQSMADRVRLYQQLMHQAGKSDRMRDLKDSLRARVDAYRMLDRARDFFSDPSDLWAALSEAKEALREEGAGQDILDCIDAALSPLEEESGPAIRAGIQGALTAAGFKDVGDADAMRDFYRQTVCAFGSVSEVFQHIQQKYGGHFDRSMDFLFAALSADIASDQPSMGLAHLESVHESLGNVRLAQSAYILCGQLMDRWENVHHVPQREGGLTAMELLGTVIGYKDIRYLGAAHVEPLLARAGAPDVEREVLFLQELLSTARGFPPALFGGAEGRMKVLDAVQEAVDKSIEREDEWLEKQEGRGGQDGQEDQEGQPDGQGN